ncbi:MAG: diacylglycerol/lipid kinase family protein [Hyphomicrobiaceae bacterium]
MRRRFFAIVNPIAGVVGSKLLPAVLAALEKAGADVVAVCPSSGADARRCAGDACRSGLFDAIVAAGGDGTIRQVAAGALGTDVPIGIIPIGTGNVMAHEIGLKPNPQDVVRALLTGRVARMRGGLVNNEPFLLMVGAGFDGRVTATLNRRMQNRFGKSAYARPVLQALVHPLDELDVAVDGIDYHANWIVVTKSRHYGGSFVLAPQTTVFSTGFYALLFQARSRTAHALQLLALACGRLAARQDVKAVPCKRVTVRCSRKTPAQIDGDAFSCTPLEVEPNSREVGVIVSAAAA